MTGADPLPGTRPPPVLAGTVLALTLLACGVGALGWPLPRRAASGWQVAEVPASLLVLVVGAAVVCLAVAAGLGGRAAAGRLPAAAVWCVLVVAAAAALVWRDLFLAARVDTGDAVVPLLDGLVAFAPALGAGLVTRRYGRAVQLGAVLGTAVVTLPLEGLGWSLTDGTTSVLAALSGGVYATAVSGVLPVVLAATVTGAAAWR